mgnify:CR=1 FL=1|tara:strand:+ start:410 stop:1114 length:705 start_codon:yes stop_codon:yes gene_type:complete
MSKRHSILLVADHASNFIPKEYFNLGLSKELIESHIAYDIGIKQLALKLQKKLKTHLVIGEYSRLLIDLNRGIMDPTLISSISHGIQINRNFNLSNRDKRFRINNIYNSYHNEISKIIKKNKINILISLHSFTPYYKNKKRDIKFGILSNNDRRFSDIIIEILSKKGYRVGDNQPYEGNLFEDTMYRHGLRNGLLHTLIETRNDLLQSQKGISNISNVLFEVIKSSKQKIRKYL